MSKGSRVDKIDYIFVTFKHSTTKQKVIDFCKVEPGASKLIRILFCLKDEVQEQKQFRGKDIYLTEAIEPEEILWLNLSFSTKSTLWKIITQLVSIICVAIILFATIFVEGKRRSLDLDYPIPQCPD